MNKGFLFIAVIVCIGLPLSALWILPHLGASPSRSSAPPAPTTPPTSTTDPAGKEPYAPEVKPGVVNPITIKPGTGEGAMPGQTLSVHYTGWLDAFNGTKKFDSSRDSGKPFQLKLGARMVIAGWEAGLVGMKVGEIRHLAIPGDLGYGERGSPPKIPPNATLYFEVELVSIQS